MAGLVGSEQEPTSATTSKFVHLLKGRSLKKIIINPVE